jgi:hypothetical protein
MLNGMAERMETTETGETDGFAGGNEPIGARSAHGGGSNGPLYEQIAERIRPYIEPQIVGSVCTAVLSGEVVRVDADVPPGAGIIALRRGILFLPSGEYRVGEE